MPLTPQTRRVGAFAAVGATLYAAPAAALYAMQGWLVFPAPVLDAAQLDAIAARVGAAPVRLEAEDGTKLYGWHRAAGGDRAVVLFHGNAETVADRVPLHDVLVDLGWDVVIVAYRGYPGSEGTPSEAGLRLDARAAWAFATDRLGIPPARVVVHGKSLGGGVAALLAEEVQPAGLVLESTFTSIADVARSRFPIYPVDTLLVHRFATRERAPSIRSRVLVLHGDRDTVIPVAHGRELATLFPHAAYVESAGLGHGESLPLVDGAAREAYERLLEQIALGSAR